VSGIDPDAMAATTVSLQFDLPRAVVMQHHIDVDRQVLTRTVSDLSGLVERHETHLEHACVSCAIREDILPTLERLAREGRWQTIVAHLPVGAVAPHLCSALKWNRGLARHLRVSAVVAAVRAGDLIGDLLGDDLLAERGHHCGPDDRRGVGEVLAAMIEFADVVVPDGPLDATGRQLVTTLARPGVLFPPDGVHLESDVLVGRLHVHSASESWTSPVRNDGLPTVSASDVWQLDLRSDRPFHPDRLLDSLQALGGGRHRSRGCFWTPSRPDRALEWDGAGGQLSIGQHDAWGAQVPFTRVVLTGVGPEPGNLREAFDELLVTPQEWPLEWPFVEDGLEPWLGPISKAA
jgi:G3E family GTPase